MSRRIAGLVGPSLMVVVAAESPLIQPDLYAQQTPSGVYLSGVLLFVAGLAIVRDHTRWARDWTILVTLCGWAMVLLGVVRMFCATAYQHAYTSAAPSLFVVLETMLFLLGLYLTIQAYRQSPASRV